MRRLLAVLALLVLAAPASAAPRGPFGHAGRWITDRDGRVVVLHGVDMVNKLQAKGYAPDGVGFGADDADLLTREGFNAVRLGLIYAGLEPQPGVYDDAYLGRIAGTQQLLADRGLLSLVDFHQDMYNERFNGEGWPDWAVADDGLPPQPNVGFPGNYLVQPALNRAWDHFWADDFGPGGVSVQGRYAAAWKHVAAVFRDRDEAFGYNLLNEPWPGSPYAGCFNPLGCADQDKALDAFHAEVITAVREADPDKLVWWAPYLTFDFGAATTTSVPDANAGFGFNLYCASLVAEAASQGSDPTPPDQKQQGCGYEEGYVFDNAAAVSERTGAALLMTEFGATDDLATIRRVADQADEEMVSWTYWSYFNEDVCCKRPNEGIVRDPSQPLTGDNVKQAKLDVLARPYPQVVAGTPQRWSFDAATRTFSARWATARAGGGTLPGGATTDISVPARHYPGGYAATVTGGRVTSASDAPTLMVVADGAAATVSVTVTPR